MNPDRIDENLSKIHTMWTTVRQAHGEGARAAPAQVRLLERYGPAVRHYLRGALNDCDAAEDVFHDFVLRFLRGGFRRADSGRGRFRDYLKTALCHLVADHQQAAKRRPESLTADSPEPATLEEPGEAMDREFLSVWQKQLLSLTWEALERHDRETGQPLYLVLRFQTDHLEMRSPEMAKRLGERLGKPVSPEWVRKWLARAHKEFADLFLVETARSLGDASLEALERELIALNMLEFCRGALERRRESVLG